MATPGSAQSQLTPVALACPPSPASSARYSPLSAPMRWPDWTVVADLAFALAMVPAALRSRKRRSSERGSPLRSEDVKKWDAGSASALYERR
jgi:hypothetical protein